jgi:DNA-3-methyladenine glycosylase II
MAPRRSARVAAATTSSAAEEKPTKPAEATKEKRARAQKNGVSKARTTKKDTKATATKVAPVPAPKFKVPELPSTPKRKKAVNIEDVPPITPTPHLASDFSSPATRRDRGDANNPASSPPPMNRPVDPHTTNATIVTPRGSHLVAYEEGSNNISPSKSGLPRPTTTTGNLLEEAVAHLIKTDPRLRPVIEKYPCRLFSPEGLADEIDPFRSLVSGIIGQQVSGAAAKSIKNKFIALFADKNDETSKAKPTAEEEAWDRDETEQICFPLPTEVAKCDIPTLRTAGLSQRKAEYIQGLAEKFANGELTAEMLLKASDEEVLEKLIVVRGLGKWSVEMFACFGLKRIDVFSTGDLGVQ